MAPSLALKADFPFSQLNEQARVSWTTLKNTVFSGPSLECFIHIQVDFYLFLNTFNELLAEEALLQHIQI